jgi:hypothetical protein
MTSLHLWAAVAASLDNQSSRDPANKSTPSIPLNQEPILMAHSSNGPNWEWKAPVLSPGGNWHLARMASLRAAIHGLPDEHEELVLLWTRTGKTTAALSTGSNFSRGSSLLNTGSRSKTAAP